MGRLAVPLDNTLDAGQALLQVFCGHYWHHLNAGVQSEEETFSHLRDLGRFLHIHHEKASPFSTLREEIGRFWLDVFQDLLHDLLDLATTNVAVASINGEPELDDA